MKIAILCIDSNKTGFVNKDISGGLGTESNFGTGFIARLLTIFKKFTISYPVLMLGYAAAILKKNGHEVKVYSNIVPEADLVIIYSSIVDYKNELVWADKIKNETKAKIGFIGTFASIKPEIYLPHSDFVICGEPEEILSKITDNWLPSGIINSTPVENLDELPVPAWELFPVNNFKYRPYFFFSNNKFFPIISSRGCSMKCAHYCPYPIIAGRKYRDRSPENVVSEIEFLVKKYNAGLLLFRDPIFSLNRKRVKRIAELIIEKKIKIKYVCETHLDNLDEELIDILHKSGLCAIKVGIESGDIDILQKMQRKNSTLEQQERIIKYCDKKGISVTGFYILGLPEDTRKSIQATIDYAVKLNTTGAQFTICTPYPGTAFYGELKDKGLILFDDFEKYNIQQLVYKHSLFTPADIQKIKNKAYNHYYLRCSWIWKIIKKKILN